MTDVLEPGTETGELPKPDPDRRPVPLWLAAASTTGWAVLTSMGPLLAVVLLTWVVDAGNGTKAIDAVRIGIGIWLLAHGASLKIGGLLVGLAPITVTALTCWQLVRAGTNAGRAVGADNLKLGAKVVATVAACYTLAGAIAAAVVLGGPAEVPILPAVASVATLGLLGSALGVLRLERVRKDLLSRFPRPALVIGRAGLAAAIAVLGAGAVAAAAGLVLHWQRTAALMGSLDGGPVGVIGLSLVCLLYVPTVSIWGAAYLTGPGFMVGAGTHVGLFGVSLGPLPAIPLLGGIPSAAAPWPAYVLLALPVAAGVGAALILKRSTAWPREWSWRFGYAALTGLVSGVLLAAAALAAAGPLGAARLAAIGPSGWQVGLSGGLEIALGAAGLVAYDYGREWWLEYRQERAEQLTEPLQTEPAAEDSITEDSITEDSITEEPATGDQSTEALPAESPAGTDRPDEPEN
ncbi:DUF6350 family protein [Fodinicola acaciae]|uniref:cell division protein PerM n=1 Tax=Fodinicola acaciae TaxID=2681555 RepID=UPI0016524173|nr:DUF6350 family protein [Fodinicola acaciae]